MFAKTEGVSCNIHVSENYIERICKPSGSNAAFQSVFKMTLFSVICVQTSKCALSGNPNNNSGLKVGNFLRSPAVTRCYVGVSECLCMWARTLMCRRTSEPSSFSWRKGKINSIDPYGVLHCSNKINVSDILNFLGLRLRIMSPLLKVTFSVVHPL